MIMQFYFEIQVAKSPDGNGGVYTGMLLFLKLSVYRKKMATFLIGVQYVDLCIYIPLLVIVCRI